MGIRIKQTAVPEPIPMGEYVARIESIVQQAGKYSEELCFQFTVARG